MTSIKNTIRNISIIFIIMMFVSCEDEMVDKLEGYESIPTNLELSYSLNNESSAYVVDFTATAEGQIFFLLKKDVDDDKPKSSTEGKFTVEYDQHGTYTAMLIAQGKNRAATDSIIVEIPEKEPAELLTSVEAANDGSGIVKFNMTAINATSFKIEIFEQDGTTLINEGTTNDNSYTYIFVNETMEAVTFNCVVKFTAINGAGELVDTKSFSVDVEADVEPVQSWGLFDNMEGGQCGGILWSASSDKSETLALADLPTRIQNGNNSATIRSYYKPAGAQYGVLEFAKLSDGTEFDFRLQYTFRVKVYLPSSAVASDGVTVDNTDNPDKKIVRLYLEDRTKEDGSSYSDAYKRNVWIEKEVSAFDEWVTIEFDFSKQEDYKYHSQAYGSYQYYIPDGYPGKNPDRMYLRTHVNGDAAASTLFYFDDFELLGIDGSSLGFNCSD